MIAGFFQTWRNAPTVNMERASGKSVLQRMAEEGYITQRKPMPPPRVPERAPPPMPRIRSRRTSSRKSGRNSRADTAQNRCMKTG